MTYLIAVQDKGGREVAAFKSDHADLDDLSVETDADSFIVGLGPEEIQGEAAEGLTCYVWDADDKLAEPLVAFPLAE